uniref:Histidine kinase/HSP90-like ATPase domain-containing protein n=1 Tax=Eutreptiella gymnastica TaxID=73025 RepID=A0A7S1I4X6_9EUGL
MAPLGPTSTLGGVPRVLGSTVRQTTAVGSGWFPDRDAVGLSRATDHVAPAMHPAHRWKQPHSNALGNHPSEPTQWSPLVAVLAMVLGGTGLALMWHRRASSMKPEWVMAAAGPSDKEDIQDVAWTEISAEESSEADIGDADDVSETDDDEVGWKVEEIAEPDEPELERDPNVIPKGQSQKFSFQTETRQILDIVAKSLYTEKEVFIRELISNAADALERKRYLSLSGEADLIAPDGPPEIRLSVDDNAHTFTIQDNGIGMTREELLANLGTIARSGSKAFLEKLKKDNVPGYVLEEETIIGQFGVGFYSVFMVSEQVQVYTRSCIHGSPGYFWEADGSGEFTITEVDGVSPGTKIVLKLDLYEAKYGRESVVSDIIRKYSNFAGFPVYLGENKINTVRALWREPASAVTGVEHTQFYKYIANSTEGYQYKLHYRIDAPVDINAVLYIGKSHREGPGVPRLEPNVSLYCKKVLIRSKCRDLLPDWMRFIHGVVDTEELPLNISRDGTQDPEAWECVKRTLVKRIMTWIATEAESNPSEYVKWFNKFGSFLKEGACSDPVNRLFIAPLLRFESSKTAKGQLTSFNEYVKRMPKYQKRIYFLHAPSRETALASPYYEVFERKGIEVLFMNMRIDEYVMAEYPEFKNYTFYSIENPKPGVANFPDVSTPAARPSMTAGQSNQYREFLFRVLGQKLMDVKVSDRLTHSPAMVISCFEQAASYRHQMEVARLQGQSAPEEQLGLQVLEINSEHPLNHSLCRLAQSSDAADISRAELMAEQLYDNCLIAAGLLDEPRLMLRRLTTLLETGLSILPVGQVVEMDAETPVEQVPKMADTSELLQALGGGRGWKRVKEVEATPQEGTRAQATDLQESLSEEAPVAQMTGLTSTEPEQPVQEHVDASGGAYAPRPVPDWTRVSPRRKKPKQKKADMKAQLDIQMGEVKVDEEREIKAGWSYVDLLGMTREELDQERPTAEGKTLKTDADVAEADIMAQLEAWFQNSASEKEAQEKLTELDALLGGSRDADDNRR